MPNIRLSIVLLSLFTLFSTAVFAASSPNLKIATINSGKILQNYAKAQQLLKELSLAEQKIGSKLADKRKEIEKAKAANKTDTELKMLIEQLRLEIEPEAKKLEEKTKKESDLVELTIRDTIKRIASKKKVDLVLSDSAVLYGGIDISEEVIGELNK